MPARGQVGNDHRVYCKHTEAKLERKVQLLLQVICGLRGSKELAEESDGYQEKRARLPCTYTIICASGGKAMQKFIRPL